VDQDFTLLLRQLKSGFQNFLRLQHFATVARPRAQWSVILHREGTRTRAFVIEVKLTEVAFGRCRGHFGPGCGYLDGGVGLPRRTGMSSLTVGEGLLCARVGPS
jgi:hypothetical protein